MNIYKIAYCYVGQESVQLFMSVKASNEYEAKDLATVELKNKDIPFSILAVELDDKVVL